MSDPNTSGFTQNAGLEAGIRAIKSERSGNGGSPGGPGISLGDSVAEPLSQGNAGTAAPHPIPDAAAGASEAGAPELRQAAEVPRISVEMDLFAECIQRWLLGTGRCGPCLHSGAPPAALICHAKSPRGTSWIHIIFMPRDFPAGFHALLVFPYFRCSSGQIREIARFICASWNYQIYRTRALAGSGLAAALRR